jgi:hypothetical protein
VFESEKLKASRIVEGGRVDGNIERDRFVDAAHLAKSSSKRI